MRIPVTATCLADALPGLASRWVHPLDPFLRAALGSAQKRPLQASVREVARGVWSAGPPAVHCEASGVPRAEAGGFAALCWHPTERCTRPAVPPHVRETTRLKIMTY